MVWEAGTWKSAISSFRPLSSRDLKKKKPQSGILFNALFNLDKFLKFENRDPFAMRAEAGEFAGLSEWDKFAKIEYYRWGHCMGISSHCPFFLLMK